MPCSNLGQGNDKCMKPHRRKGYFLCVNMELSVTTLFHLLCGSTLISSQHGHIHNQMTTPLFINFGKQSNALYSLF